MKSTIFVGETPTDVYWLKNDRADLKRAIVVIPGNPGIIEFYKTFLHGLFEHFEEQIPVVGISHAGHGADSDKIFSVQEQIQHKVQFLSQELPDAELVLVGHSVGSYISLHISRHHPFNVAKVVNLFPTFQKLQDGIPPMLKPIILNSWIRETACYIIHYLPTFVKRMIVGRTQAELDEESQQIVLPLLKYITAKNVFYMAHTECVEITDLDHELIEPQLNKLLFLYGTEDKYTPISQIETFRQRYSNSVVHLTDEKHAFCVCKKQSTSVAEKVAKLLVQHWMETEVQQREAFGTSDSKRMDCKSK